MDKELFSRVRVRHTMLKESCWTREVVWVILVDYLNLYFVVT